MILAVGVDVVGVDRFARALARTPSLRERLFTPAELERGGLAAGFAAKEALAKALGAPPGLAWHDAEVRGSRLLLHGTVAEAAAGLGVRRTRLHLVRDPGTVTALVTLES